MPAVAGTIAERPIASIPFVTSGNLIVIELKPEGVDPLTLVFDSGSSTTVLHSGTVERLGLALSGRSVDSHGAGGAGRAGVVKKRLVFRLGSARVESPGASVIDLESLRRRLGLPVDGIIGGEVLQDHVVRVDYGARRIDLFAAGTKVESEESIRLQFRHGIPVVQAGVVALDGTRKHGRFYIDTGASRSVVLTAHFARSLAVPDRGARSVTILARGAHSSFPSRVTRIGRVELGGFELSRPLALISGARRGILSERSMGGVIGAAALQRFVVTFDYPRKRMHLDRAEDFAAPDEFDASGLQLHATGDDYGRVEVRGVLPNTPAYEHGIEELDEILSLDGEPAGALGLEAVRTRLREAGTAVTVKLRRNGTDRTVELRLRRLL